MGIVPGIWNDIGRHFPPGETMCDCGGPPGACTYRTPAEAAEDAEGRGVWEVECEDLVDSYMRYDIYSRIRPVRRVIA